MPGWIDYAFLAPGDVSVDLNKSGVFEPNEGYLEGQHGGRRRPDGKQLEWIITVRKQRGVLPFFCADLTPRELRVGRVRLRHPM